jgi:hypothetical protein
MYIYIEQYHNNLSNSCKQSIFIKFYKDYDDVKSCFLYSVAKYCDFNKENDDNKIKKHICKCCEYYHKNIDKKRESFDFKSDNVQIEFKLINDSELFNSEFYF